MAREHVIRAEIQAVDKTKQGVESAKKGIKEVGAEAEKTGNKAKESGEKGHKSYLKLAAGVAAGVAAFAAVKGAMTGVISTMKDLTQFAAVQAEAEDLFNRALVNTGQYSDLVSASLRAQASALQELTVFGDEAILQQSTMALGMGVSADKLGELQKVAADLAAGMRMDLSGAFKVVSQAALGNIAMAGRYVPAVRLLTKEQAAAGEGLRVLGEAFDGFAEAQSKTYMGALSQLSNSWGDFKEVLGSVITTNPAIVAAIRETKDQINALIGVTSGGTDTVQRLVRHGLIYLFDAMSAGVTVAHVFLQAFQALRLTFQGVLTGVLVMAEGVVKALGGIGKAVAWAAGGFKGAFSEMTSPLDGFAHSLERLRIASVDTMGSIVDQSEAINDGAAVIKQSIGDIGTAVVNAKQPVEDLREALGGPQGLDKAAESAGKALKNLAGERGLEDLEMEFISLFISARDFKERGIDDLADAMAGRAMQSVTQFRAALVEMAASGKEVTDDMVLSLDAMVAQFAQLETAGADMEDEFSVTFESLSAGIVNWGQLAADTISRIVAGIVEAASFNKAAALSFAEDQQWAAQSATMAWQDSARARDQAEQALREAREQGDEAAFMAAHRNLQKTILAEKKAAKARKDAAEASADARAEAEETAGQRIMRTIGQVLLDVVSQVLAAAATQVIASSVAAAAQAIANGAAIPGPVGIAIGLATAALFTAAILPLLGKLKPQRAAAEGGIMMGSDRYRDAAPVYMQGGEVALNHRQQVLAFGAPLAPQGVTSGGMGRIRDEDLTRGRGGGSPVINLHVTITEAVKDAQQIVQQIAPALRHAMAQGLL